MIQYMQEGRLPIDFQGSTLDCEPGLSGKITNTSTQCKPAFQKRLFHLWKLFGIGGSRSKRKVESVYSSVTEKVATFSL